MGIFLKVIVRLYYAVSFIMNLQLFEITAYKRIENIFYIANTYSKIKNIY